MNEAQGPFGQKILPAHLGPPTMEMACDLGWVSQAVPHSPGTELVPNKCMTQTQLSKISPSTFPYWTY